MWYLRNSGQISLRLRNSHLKEILPSKVSNRGKKDQDLRRFKTLSEKLKVNVEKPKTSFEEIRTTLKEGEDFVIKT